MNGGIFYWIFAALSNLMETLEAQGQTAKLSLFQQLWWLLSCMRGEATQVRSG